MGFNTRHATANHIILNYEVSTKSCQLVFFVK